jgi:lysozyme
MIATNLKPSGACRALIREFEGCRLEAYRDSKGIPTIGVGHTRGVRMGDRCSVQQADVWLSQDLEDAVAGVQMLVKAPITQSMFDALVSFTFNLGTRQLGESTMLILINKRNYKAAAEQFQRWNRAGDQVLAGLTRRRAAEAALFLDDGIPS